MAFTFYSPITINAGQVPRPQSDFPILINYTDSRFKSSPAGHVQNASGFDIRPYADAGLTVPLTYELERYNPSTGEVVMWVKKSYVFDGDVTYLGYGDSSLSSDGSSSLTWSNAFIGVWHLKDGTTLSISDSANSLPSTNHGATATAGQIDGGGSFVSASSQYISLDTIASSSTDGTISAWVNATSFPNAYNCIFGGVAVGAVPTSLLVKSTGKLAPFFAVSGVARGYDGTGTNTLVAATWYHIAMTYNRSTISGFVNASLDGTLNVSGTWDTLGSGDIGQDAVTAGRFWNGTLDEVRASRVVRSGDWLTTEYNNQSAPSTFATLGTEVAFTLNRGLFTK